MVESNDSEKTDGQEPVNERTGGQESVPDKSKGERRFFTAEKIGYYTLIVGGITLAVAVLGLLIGLFFTVSFQYGATRAEIAATRAEMLKQIEKISDRNVANRAETLVQIQSLGKSLRADIRAEFSGIDARLNSSDSRVDKLYDLENQLNQQRDEEFDSLENRVSSLEEAQESEG